MREKTRIENQQKMSFEQMLDDLPKNCDIGKKKSANGHTLVWKGYKLHTVTDDQVYTTCSYCDLSVYA